MLFEDNFIGDKLWLQEFMNSIKHLELTWHAAVSTDVGKDLLQLDKMRETGCRSLYIGFESINPQSLSAVRKKQNRYQNMNKRLKKSTIAEL